MGRDSKYGYVITQHGEIPDDEPVIVFRARDVHTPNLLAYYLELCDDSPVRHRRIIADTLARFLSWQEQNPDAVKVPDSERSRAWGV